MSGLISRQAVRLIESDPDVYPQEWNDDYERGFVDALNKVLALPSAERKGKWIETADGTMCSNCHRFPYDDGEYHMANWSSDFCPNCGADMRGEEDD